MKYDDLQGDFAHGCDTKATGISRSLRVASDGVMVISAGARAEAAAGLLPESRCRICRDPRIRRIVDELLSWRGAPVRVGTRFRCITLAEVHRRLAPINADRGLGDQISYTSLWNHRWRHYEVDGVMARVDARLLKHLQRLSAPDRGTIGASQ